MIYENTDSCAIDAMERARTGNYGEDSYYSTYNRYWDVMADEKYEEMRDEKYE